MADYLNLSQSLNRKNEPDSLLPKIHSSNQQRTTAAPNLRLSMRKALTTSLLLLLLISTGCSTYTLKPITASQAQSAYPVGAYRIACPHAVLVHSTSVAFGFGQPDLELTTVELPQIGLPAIARLPQNTPIKIDRYVQFEQHGLYDCGSNGWQFAIGHVTDGQLANTHFLIDKLNLDEILNPKQNTSANGKTQK